MATYLTIRNDRLTGIADRFGGGLAGSFALHAAIAALLLSWAYIWHSGQNWGSTDSTAGAVQATMVPDIPLPPKAPTNPDNMLATDTPSPAPLTKPQAIETPTPDAVPIPVKPTKPAKAADQSAPPPPLHPQPLKIDPNKVQAGQGAGLNVAMSSIQTRAGTTSVNVSDQAFGTRFAYYVNAINSKVASQWYTTLLDPQAVGHRLYVTFQVERDGSITHIQILQRSGDATLDQTGLSAVQHVDNFPPLPDAYTGSHLSVTYYFDPPSHP